MNSIFIQIDENPNCAAMDGQVFQPRTEPRAVRQIRLERRGEECWCDVAALDEGGAEREATVCLVDDSGDGSCFLVVGGAWGLHFRHGDDEWGEPYLLLAANEQDLRLK